MRYYTVDFVAKTGGSVQVLAQNKEDAWKLLSQVDYVSNQVEDQVPFAPNMSITFYKHSIKLDDEQEPCCEWVPSNVPPKPPCEHEWYFPVGMKNVASCRKCTAMRDLS